MTPYSVAATVCQLSIAFYLMCVQDTLARVLMCFVICVFVSNKETLILQILALQIIEQHSMIM